MEKEELDRIKAQSDEVIRGVEELQEQIKKYKRGAESFELAVGILGEIGEQEKKVMNELGKYLGTISKASTKGMVGTLREIEEKLEDIRDDFGEIEKKVLVQQREERKLEKEIRELRGELADFRDSLAKNDEKRGKILRLFRKK